MKKNCILISSLTLIFPFAISCSQPHVHVFDKKVLDYKYIFINGTCTHKAQYYYSCDCGLSSKGTEFEDMFDSDYGNHQHRYIDAKPGYEGWDSYYICDSCYKYFDKDSGGNFYEIPNIPWHSSLFIKNKKVGAAMQTMNPIVKSYLELNDDPNTENNEIAEFLSKNNKLLRDITPVSLSCNSRGNMPSSVKAVVFSDEECTKLVGEYDMIAGGNFAEAKIYNLIPNKYYYYVIDSNGEKTSVDSFTLDSNYRIIYTGGSILNMRDLGGKLCQNSKKIKYGILYRSASWSDINKEAESIIKSLGIKTELDVRKGSSYTTSGHPIEGVKFIQAGLTDYYGEMLTDKATISSIKQIIELIADGGDSLPLVFHCTAGADRTGLCAMIIEGALGVSDEDIYRDYETTTFYNGLRVRADVVNKDGVYSFRPDGKVMSNYNETSFQRVINEQLSIYEGRNISEKVVNFLITKCGISPDTINELRNKLLY